MCPWLGTGSIGECWGGNGKERVAKVLGPILGLVLAEHHTGHPCTTLNVARRTREDNRDGKAGGLVQSLV